MQYNHFIEFSVSEMVDAYVYFTHIRDYEGCRLVAEAFDSNTRIDLNGFFND